MSGAVFLTVQRNQYSIRCGDAGWRVFSLSIPSLGDLDAFLRRMATAILTCTCQAATSVFNTAVNNATQSIGGQVAPITSLPGVLAGISTSTTGSSGVSVRGSVNTDNVANHVVNTLK